MELSNNNLPFCIRTVKTLSNFDTDALTESIEAYARAGMPMNEACPAAVADLLATITSERDEVVRLVREQHPQCFICQDGDEDE